MLLEHVFEHFVADDLVDQRLRASNAFLTFTLKLA